MTRAHLFTRAMRTSCGHVSDMHLVAESDVLFPQLLQADSLASR